MRLSNQKVLLTVVFTLSFAAMSFAQTVNEAGEKLNEGIQNLKAQKYDLAISSFESCIQICDMVGMDAFDVRSKAESQIPNVYFKSAVAKYKSKDYLAAIEKFKKTAEIAKKYNNTKLERNSAKNVPALYSSLANAEIKRKNFDKAIGLLDEAIAYNNKYIKAYFAKARVYKAQKNTALLQKNVDKIIEIKANGKTAINARELAGNYFLNDAINAIG
ncbi:MAG: hypothetical protein U9R32_06600, partial [Bacteroidota bacterium]|nr:hypothetical protein [Bacteroidota bacterium]